ncbi:hypothetical protein NWE61_02420 [Mycoplasmopsis felis]|nr:hypothetical protein [Mycoplasmopsis felis]MCU9934040.1 hypothetical protein [Mycoplasmopsis felis]
MPNIWMLFKKGCNKDSGSSVFDANNKNHITFEDLSNEFKEFTKKI